MPKFPLIWNEPHLFLLESSKDHIHKASESYGVLKLLFIYKQLIIHRKPKDDFQSHKITVAL